MQKCTLITGLLFLFGCTKHDAPLSPRELLMTSSPWKLQRSDSFHLSDDLLTVTSTNSFIPSDCSRQPHYIFKTDHTVNGYLQCDQPADPSTKWTWSLDTNRLDLSTPIPFIRGSMPPRPPLDTIVTLTNDSLVTHQSISPGQPYISPLTTGWLNHPVLVIDRYTH